MMEVIWGIIYFSIWTVAAFVIAVGFGRAADDREDDEEDE